MIVHCENMKRDVPRGVRSLGDALRSAGLMIDMRCGGHGVCGKCEIELLKGRFRIGDEIFSADAPRKALACLCYALEDSCEVAVPKESMADDAPQCLEAFQGWLLPSTRVYADGVGAAIDVGTTTVAISFVDLRDGRVLATDSKYNAQLRFGDNVIARVAYAFGDAAKREELRRVLVEETINPLLRALSSETGVPLSSVRLAAASGNTVMSHLLFAFPTDSMGSMPFTPHTCVYPKVMAASLGMALPEDVELLTAPSVSGFIGGDSVSGAETARLALAGEPCALLDLGTNCETLVFDGSKIMACASAAGPAFEGAGIACGQRAAKGAIDRLRIGEGLDFKFSTIGGATASGLCGSAMLDFLAEARRVGLLNEFGRFDAAALSARGRATKVFDEGFMACRLDEEGKLFVSEKDVEQLLKAKAAIASGLKTLCEEIGRPLESLSRIFLAGGFAQYLDVKAAIAIGMLPPLTEERYVKIGNSSLAGAMTLLLDPSAADRFGRTASSIGTIVLNTAPSFEDNYIDALCLP